MKEMKWYSIRNERNKSHVYTPFTVTDSLKYSVEVYSVLKVCIVMLIVYCLLWVTYTTACATLIHLSYTNIAFYYDVHHRRHPATFASCTSRPRVADLWPLSAYLTSANSDILKWVHLSSFYHAWIIIITLSIGRWVRDRPSADVAWRSYDQWRALSILTRIQVAPLNLG